MTAGHRRIDDLHIRAAQPLSKFHSGSGCHGDAEKEYGASLGRFQRASLTKQNLFGLPGVHDEDENHVAFASTGSVRIGFAALLLETGQYIAADIHALHIEARAQQGKCGTPAHGA